MRIFVAKTRRKNDPNVNIFLMNVKVLELKGPYEPGTWSYNISVEREFVGQSAVIVVHLNVKNEVLVQGFLDENASLASVNGSQTKAVKAFAYLQKSSKITLENTFGVLCKTWIHQNQHEDPLNFRLSDNGLTSKYDTGIPRNLFFCSKNY